jgi:hypothetical protein
MIFKYDPVRDMPSLGHQCCSGHEWRLGPLGDGRRLSTKIEDE